MSNPTPLTTINHWGNHPDFPVEDWQYEVANNDTRLGYQDWLESRLELESEDKTNPVFVLSLEQAKQVLLIFNDAERWYKEIPDLVEEDFDPGTFDQWESNWAVMERLEQQLRQFIDPTLAPATAGDHR